MSLTWHIGDVRKVLATLEPGSVDLVLTSPPFLALRSYLPADHPDKASEIGAETTPGEFIDTLLDVVELCTEVLAPHGSLCFELGDTYAGDDRRNHEVADPRTPHRQTIGRPASSRANLGHGWPLDKSLCLIPELFRVALVYGRNPLTGRQTPRWRARNVIRWCRPNPPVGALGDKFRPGTSEMVVLCKSRTRYFDLDAVRTASTYDRPNLRGQGARRFGEDVPGQRPNHSDHITNPAGAPPLDWWEIPTQGYPGSHYATWPKALLLRPIKAMCPERVCVTCGEPSRRIVEPLHTTGGAYTETTKGGGLRVPGFGDRGGSAFPTAVSTTTGWTDCGHADYRPGVVLDPFAGSGTTLDVAHGLGRSAIGIDLDGRNLLLAQDRLGMFGIDVVDHTEQVAT